MGDNITGRKYDHDVLENEEQVAEVIDNLNTIATKGVSDAQDGVNEAITALNNVKGLSEYVGTINTAEIGTIFTEITTSVQALGTAMQQSADSIKEFDEAEWYEKAGSTILMGLAKVGEGLLGILEDLGDGAVSILGAVTFDAGNWASNFIKKEWSHEVFEGYYNSDLAKKSGITEDSLVASGFKVFGTTVGYIGLSMATAGALGGIGAGVSATGGAAATFASSTTIANTVMAGIAGLGTGTESGLRQDKGFYEALFTNGVFQGVTQAAIAFAAGKVGERMAYKKALKSASNAVDEANDMVGAASKAKSVAMKNFNKAQSEYDEALKAMEAIESKPGFDFSKYEKAFERFQKADSALSSATTEKELAESFLERQISNSKSAEAAFKKIDDAKPASFQGYSDKITNKYFEKGQKIGSLNKVTEEAGALKKTGAFIKSSAQGAKSSISESVMHPITTAKSIVQNVGYSVAPVTTTSSVPGLVGAAGVVASKTSGLNIGSVFGINNATPVQVNNSTFDPSTVPEKTYTINDAADIDRRISGNFIGGQSTPPASTPTPSGNTGSNPSSSSGTSTGSTSGGYTSGGNTSSGGYSTGSPSYQSTVDSGNTSSQLKKAVEETVTDPVTEVAKTTSATTPETTTPVDTPVQTTPQETPAAVVTVPESNGGYYDTTYHTGGGYSGEGYYQDVMGETPVDTSVNSLNPLDETLQDNSASIDEIVKGSKYTKIPSSSKPITTTTSTGSGSSSVIPIAAGLSAAAAAGIGAKAYMDRKKNNDFNDDEDDDFETEEWSGDDESVNVDYDDSSDTQLDNDDDYSYQTEPEEKYGARSNEELADLQ